MTKKLVLFVVLLLPLTSTAQSFLLQGSVTDVETRDPLPFATIQIVGTTYGTTTDEAGKFSLSLPSKPENGKLLVTFVGYQSDTIMIANQSKINIQLRADANSLREVVVVSGTMKEVSKMNSPIPVEIYTPALFLKNPVPNIFESLSMVNGVQPQLNCNVCNTGDIHINGMEGPYTMVLIDGMPIVSSLSTVYGLAGIPNSMVKRIEVVKGPASTLYGSEAVGGLINIITKDPASSALLKTDLSATSLQEYNLDVATKGSFKGAQTLLGFNYFYFKNPIDINDDNFTDVTQQQRVSMFNKWTFDRQENREASFAVRYVYEDRWGGELQWDRSHRGSNKIYGESIYTNRVELIGKYDLPLHEKITFDYSYNYHLQDSYYGVTPYLANQHVAFTQLRWDKKIGRHDLLAGVPLRYTFYDDNTPGTASKDTVNQVNEPMRTILPGIFIQDEWSFSEKMTMLMGARYDHHNRHGNIFSPRLSLKYSPDKNNTLRLSTGNGFRVVNLFTEDHAALTGARQVVIANELKPEESWNVNFNYSSLLTHNQGFVNLDLSLFYTYFTNKIVGDFMTNPEQIIYDNLSGHAISKGITVNVDAAFTSSLKIIAGVTLMDVYQVGPDSLDRIVRTPQIFAPKVSGTYSISYSLDNKGLTFDLTGRLSGPMKLPTGDRSIDKRPDYSPWFTIVNFQTTKTFNSGVEIYGGVKNILNFIPKDPLLEPQNPFGQNFDTSYNYASIQGIKGFLGVRYTLH